MGAFESARASHVRLQTLSLLSGKVREDPRCRHLICQCMVPLVDRSKAITFGDLHCCRQLQSKGLSSKKGHGCAERPRDISWLHASALSLPLAAHALLFHGVRFA